MKFCSVYFRLVIKQEYAKPTKYSSGFYVWTTKSRAVIILNYDNAMKFVLGFLVVFLFSTDGHAQFKDKQESAYLKIKSGDETITYEFDSVIDFEENSEKILNEITATNPTNKKEKDANLTIEISITITSDNESTTITGSVTAYYSSIITAVKKLRSQLVSIVIG